MNTGIIIDIVVVAIVVLIAVIGIKRGFIKTLVGLLSIVITIALSVLLTTTVADLVADGTEWDTSLKTELSNSLADSLPNADATVYFSDQDNDPETDLELVYVVRENGTTSDPAQLKEALSAHLLWKLLPSGLLEDTAAEMLNSQAEAEEIPVDSVLNTVSLLDAVSQSLVNVIFIVAAFIALCIVIRFLLWLVLLLLKKISQRVYLAYFLDKTLGGILGLALGAVVVILVITILQLLGSLSFMEPVNEQLQNTTVTKMIMDNNFVYDFVSKYIDLSSLGK